jgi:fumarate hydratase subunit beta
VELKRQAPLSDEDVFKLKAGDNVLISGVIYTARDAAHKKLVELMDKGEELPIDLTGQFIYYVGPTPAKPGQAIGSAGPTTSGRMDAYTPQMLVQGMKACIGKGLRSAVKRSADSNTKASTWPPWAAPERCCPKG